MNQFYYRRMKQVRNNVLLLAGMMLALSGCKITNKMSSQNIVGLYDPASLSYNQLQVVVFNRDNDLSRMYIRILPDALVSLVPPDPKEAVSLKYIVTKAYTSTELVDSGSIQLEIPGTNQPLILERDLRTPAGTRYVVSLVASRAQLGTVLEIDRSALYGRQDYLLTDEAGNTVFSDYILPGSPYRLMLEAASLNRVQVRQYKRRFPVAMPPYAYERDMVFDYKADSVYYISMTEGISEPFVLPEGCFAHFVADTTRRAGKTIFAFYEGFPSVLNAVHMMEPLRYLTTSKEFEGLSAATDNKLAVDRFWLSLTGNAERARTRIRAYYSRVEQANHLFSTYHEGWKTDRGLIYIIYGPPRIVYRSDDTEKWIYGDEQSTKALRLVFSKIDNPFTPQDYGLNKSSVYRESWFNAVEVWRR